MGREIDIRALSELSSSDRAFLSLYLSSPGSFEKLEGRVKNLESILSGNPDELIQFKENMKLVRTYLREKPQHKGSQCFFCCWLMDFFRWYSLDFPVTDLIRIGPSPYLRPVAERMDNFGNFSVVVADHEKARMFLVTSAAFEDEGAIKAHIKNHVKVGGWSQHRYERRRDKAIHEYTKEIEEKLVETETEIKLSGILLVGAKEAISEIAKSLPKHLSDKLMGEKTLDLGRGESYIHREIYDLFIKEEKQAEVNLWHKIKERYLRHEMAVVGSADVLHAAQEGRVEKAIVNRDAQIYGVRCRRCSRLHAGHPDRCPHCGSDSIFDVDLINEIVEQLALTNAELEFVEDLEELKNVGDIAALLRY